MLTKTKLYWMLTLVFALGCGLFNPASNPTPDLLGTLQASTPSGFSSPVPGDPIATPDFSFPTLMPSAPAVPGQTSIPSPSSSDQPAGHIFFTCQVYKVQAADQICIMNADGTGYRRVTSEDGFRHFYASPALNANSVLYSAFREQNYYEIYELDLIDGSIDRLTNRLGVLTAPEVSPNGEEITFTRGSPNTNELQIWVMDRNGENADKLAQVLGWDPTWSPDSKQILFASDRDGLVQLFTVNRDGRGLLRVTNLPAIRGRSDWSPDGQSIVTYSGPAWNREVYIMSADGSNLRQLTPTGGNSQGPTFSPDGRWVAFTAYFDKYGDDHGCEIYIIRIDGTDLRRLTNNDYCDYQPRWGP